MTQYRRRVLDLLAGEVAGSAGTVPYPCRGEGVGRARQEERAVGDEGIPARARRDLEAHPRRDQVGPLHRAVKAGRAVFPAPGAEQGVETGEGGRVVAVAAGLIELKRDPRQPLRIEGVARPRMEEVGRDMEVAPVSDGGRIPGETRLVSPPRPPSPTAQASAPAIAGSRG